MGAGDNIDLDALVKGLQDPTVGNNAESLLGMVKELNIVLGELGKTFDIVNKYGVLAPTIRIIASKMEVDIDKPLAGNINPTSDWHKMLYEQLNTMSPEDAVKEMVVMSKKIEKASTPEPAQISESTQIDGE